MEVYPNPAKDYLTLAYELKQSEEVQVSLMTLLGQQVTVFSQAGGDRSPGQHNEQLSLDQEKIASGLYFLVVKVGNKQESFKVNIMR